MPDEPSASARPPRTRRDPPDPVANIRLSLPGSVLHKSLAAARAAGVPVEAWIAQRLREATADRPE